MTRLRDAHVLITGGSSGIGLETARLALARGARVSIVGRHVERLRAALADLEDTAGDRTRVAAEPADVTDPQRLGDALGLLVAQFGPVDVLVTSAGAARPGHFERLARPVFDEQMAVDYFGTLDAVRGTFAMSRIEPTVEAFAAGVGDTVGV